MKGPRRTLLLEVINSKPFVSLHELEDMFPEYSSMTLRRDIEFFEQEGKLIKVRGGCKSMKYVMASAEDDFSERLRLNRGAKDLIARKALSFIEPGRSFFFDAGSTMLRVAELMNDEHVTIVTSGINIALELIKKDLPMVNMVGGLVHRDSITVSGKQTSDFINSVNIDTAFIVPSGLSDTDGLTCGNYIHGELKSQIVERAKRVIVLVDSSKVGKSLPYTFCGIEDVDVIVCEDELPESIVRKAKENGVEIIKA